jgi:ATP-dependent DNA helicase PIF1
MAMAFTGVAAILLEDGKTLHTSFRLPLNMDDSSSCKLSREERLKVKNTHIIICDEAPMAPVQALKMINATLKDIMQNNEPFGGKIIILAGIFELLLSLYEMGKYWFHIRKI